MSLNDTHCHLVKDIIEVFNQMEKELPGEGWIYKAETLEHIEKEMGYRVPKKQVMKSGVTCCGTCGHRVKDKYTYCNHCGQAQIFINKKEDKKHEQSGITRNCGRSLTGEVQ